VPKPKRVSKNKYNQIVITEQNGTITRQKLTEKQVRLNKEKNPPRRDKRNEMVDLVIRGKTVQEIARALDVDHKQIYRWYALDPSVKEDIDKGRQARAYYFENQIHELLEATTKKSHVAVAKLKLDGYTRLAKWSNPDKFSEKKIVEGNADKPIQLIFQTGVDRSPPKEVESTTEEDD